MKKPAGALRNLLLQTGSQKTACQFGIWIFILVILTSCEEKIEWDFPEKSYNTIVVNAILTNELKRQEIRLSRPFSDPSQIPEPVSGATVNVQADGFVVPFYESDDEPGLYQTQQPAAATVGKTYNLQINADGMTYTASTYMVPVLPPNYPSFQFVPDTGLYRIRWNNPQYSPFEQAMYEADISWGHLPGFNSHDTLTKARILYYTLSTIDVSYVIIPQDKEEVYFPKGSIAILKKYALNDEYTAYLRSLLAETEWQGSLFEDARGNLPTNISNGGLGYFSTCSVISDTLIVQ